MNFIFKFAQGITNSRTFKIFIFSIITFSAILIGLETYPDIVQKYRNLILFLDRLIITCFVIEIGLKIIAMEKKPWQFFKDPWNVFDFIIVAVCLIPSDDTHYFAVFRILRVLRILRMITFLPKLRLLIGALLKSIPSMGYVVMLISILFYVYAVIGVFVFGASDPLHFGDLHHTMVTLFKVLTLEGWIDIMNTHILGAASDGRLQIISFWPFLYFASFILIGAMIIMNLFIGVIMNSMEESQKELTQELRKINYNNKDEEELFKHLISKLDELRDEIQNLKKPTGKAL
ncbi:MAG: Ion transport [Prolixibacteraceae bacterium]|nr:MAG: Ion transport [Prolixibacteraceae bacterium]